MPECNCYVGGGGLGRRSECPEHSGRDEVRESMILRSWRERVEGAAHFDSEGNAIVGNIAIPASHVDKFRALLGTASVDAVPENKCDT